MNDDITLTRDEALSLIKFMSRVEGFFILGER